MSMQINVSNDSVIRSGKEMDWLGQQDKNEEWQTESVSPYEWVVGMPQ